MSAETFAQALSMAMTLALFAVGATVWALFLLWLIEQLRNRWENLKNQIHQVNNSWENLKNQIHQVNNSWHNSGRDP